MQLKDWLMTGLYAAISSYAIAILFVFAAPLLLAGRELPIDSIVLVAAIIFPLAFLAWAWNFRRQIAKKRLTLPE